MKGATTHSYKTGDYVLCFEPDPIKAKIIYHAKILSQSGFRIDGRIKKPTYEVHFQGWKDKWDREVVEDMLLDDTPFNRTLKAKIEEVAKKVKNKELRRERIDWILTSAAKVANEEEFDWIKVPGIWNEKDEGKRKQKPTVSHTSNSRSGEGDDAKSTAASDGTDSQAGGEKMGSSEILSKRLEDEEAHLKFTPDLVLSSSLRAVLESDYTAVQTGHLHSLPSKTSALDLLQSYVDAFPISNIEVPPAPPDANESDDDDVEDISDLADEYTQADRNRVLCAEVCNGLRILLDFLLKDHLLYRSEWVQHDDLMTSFIDAKSTDSKEANKAEPPHKRPCRRTSRQRESPHSESDHAAPIGGTSETQKPVALDDMRSESKGAEKRLELLPVEERIKSPDLPCLLYGPVHLLRLFVKLPGILARMALTRCRRAIVLRHLTLFLRYLEINADRWFFIPTSTLSNPSENGRPTSGSKQSFKKSTASKNKTTSSANGKTSVAKAKSVNVRSHSVSYSQSSDTSSRLRKKRIV